MLARGFRDLAERAPRLLAELRASSEEVPVDLMGFAIRYMELSARYEEMVASGHDLASIRAVRGEVVAWLRMLRPYVAKDFPGPGERGLRDRRESRRDQEASDATNPRAAEAS